MKIDEVMEFAKKELIDELAEGTVNILKVRALCRDYPGIIANTGLRKRIWTRLLLGSDTGLDQCDDEITVSENPCQEQHVLEADGSLFVTNKLAVIEVIFI